MNGERKVTRSIERANQMVRRYLAARLRRLGLTEIEAHLVARLAARGPCSVSDLRAAFGLRPSTLTNALDRLERKRFLRRRPDPGDRRSFLLELTAAGRRASRSVVGLVDALEERVSSRVSPEQLDDFLAVIAAVEASLD
jgi:MarR family transcriptional regulator, organic hydroperoxide resistance regulator